MRKLVLALLMLLTLSLKAQFKEVVRFMGIPVDGTEAEMISQLKTKGFTYDKENGYLEGRFNGEQVKVFVHTNGDLVDRVMVVSDIPVNETEIKINFNNLVRQFENNDRYLTIKDDQFIGADVDISYEMLVHNKRFEASYHQCYSKDDLESLKKWFNDDYERLMDSFDKEEFGLSVDGDKDENINSILAMLQMAYAITNDVWFMIIEDSYNHYNISIFYDNLMNRPKGEDL